jgi:hypothetical protein
MEIWRTYLMVYFACLKMIRNNMVLAPTPHFHYIFTDPHV